MKKTIIEEWERGWFGAVIKWLFYVFNAFMALWFALWITSQFYMLFCIVVFDDTHMVGPLIEAFKGFPMLAFVWVAGDCNFLLMLLAIHGKKGVRQISRRLR